MPAFSNSVFPNPSWSKLQNALNIDCAEMKDLAQMSDSEYENGLNKWGQAPFNAHYCAAKKLNVNVDDFVSGKFDLIAVSEHYRGNKLHLSERYSKHKESKIRTIKNVLNLIQKQYREEAMRALHLTDEILEDSEKKISGIALMDLFEFIHQKGLPLEQFKLIGDLCCKQYKDILLDTGVTEDFSTKYLYEEVIYGIFDKVEKNLLYQIERSDERGFVLDVSTREETKDNLGIENFGNRQHCYNIMGWFGTILEFRNGHKANVTKLSCVHQGDKSCRYHIAY